MHWPSASAITISLGSAPWHSFIQTFPPTGLLPVGVCPASSNVVLQEWFKMRKVHQHAQCKADWQLNGAALEQNAATNTKLIFDLKKQWLLDFVRLSDIPKLKKMALVRSAMGPVNSRKNQKQLRPYSQRHIFGFTRGFSLLQSTIVIR
jgi:hypothetical protein